MGNHLREIRKSKSLTQCDLATCANVHRTVIARYEIGKTRMSTKNLCKIARALGCSMEDILGEGPDGEAV